MEYSKDSEPPQSYHIWTGISVLAGALERRCYIEAGETTIYPNLYIILVGPAGEARKGTALKFGAPLLTEAGLKVIDGAITREKLIRRMAESVTSKSNLATGHPFFQCAVTFVSNELSVFLGQQNIKLLADLCDWYDCPDVWKYDTKGQGSDKIDGMCFNLLGATAPDWLTSILPAEAIAGGMSSRIIWVVEENRGKIVPFPTIDKALRKQLVHDLEQISLLSGEFTYTEDGMKFYGDWYVKTEESSKNGYPIIMDTNFAAYCSRRATTVRKIAMAISASSNDDMVISKSILERSILLLSNIEKKMPRVFRGMGSTRYYQAMELLMGFLLKRGEVTRTQVLRFFMRDIDDYTFDIIVRSLEAARAIKVTRDPHGNEITLRPVEGYEYYG